MLKSIPIVLISFILAGCPEEFQGDTGATGTVSSAEIVAAVENAPGLNCWDLNANGIADGEEDRNHDTIVDVKDCHYDHDTLQQNPGALYDQEKMCKTLHLFGQAALSAGATTMDAADLADTLKDLGCHSLPISAQDGTMQQIFFPSIRDGVYPLFSYEPSTFTNIPGFDLVMHQAYIAKTLERAFEDGHALIADCELACNGDPECVATFQNNTMVDDTTVQCHLFHHSDSLITDWRNWCGFEIDDTGLGIGSSCEGFTGIMYIKK